MAIRPNYTPALPPEKPISSRSDPPSHRGIRPLDIHEWLRRNAPHPMDARSLRGIWATPTVAGRVLDMAPHLVHLYADHDYVRSIIRKKVRLVNLEDLMRQKTGEVGR